MENDEIDETTQKSLDNIDVLILFILTASSFIVRYWRISLPPTTVFDEVYFGNFSNYYIQSQFFYDIHPPLAKLIMFYIANLSEYNGSMSFQFNAKGYPLPDYVQLRITPATFSALVFPLIYISMRFSGFSYVSSLCSSVLAFCDTSLATEGRHILTDGILHFFTILHVAVLSYTMSIKAKYRATAKFYIWHILTGITLGCACSCKNTAWGLTVFDAFCYILQFTDIISIKNFRKRKRVKKVDNKKEKKIKDQNETDQKMINNDTKTEPPKNSPSTGEIASNDTNFTIIGEITQPHKTSTFSSDSDQQFNDSASLFEKIYSSENSLKKDKDEATESTTLISSSLLDIHSSIESSIINVTSNFNKEFDEVEFIKNEGTGGGILDYIFSITVFGFTLAVLGLSVYIISFYIHFILLPYAGKGVGFLRPDMKKQLIPNQCATCRRPNVTIGRNQIARKANYDETFDQCINSALYAVRIQKPSLFLRTFILAFRMHTGNMRIVGFHDSQSFPKHWPILSSVSTYFWGMNGREIRCLGNAIVYYLALFSLIFLALYSLFKCIVLFGSLFITRSKIDNIKRSISELNNISLLKKWILKGYSKFMLFLFDSKSDSNVISDALHFSPYCDQKWLIALRFIVGYSVSYFPFYWIPRTLYLYHYLIPLIFGCLSFGSMVEIILPMRYCSVFVVFVCIAAAFGFWLWSPYVYGTDRHDLKMMIWTRRWIDGDEEHKKAKLERNKNKK